MKKDEIETPIKKQVDKIFNMLKDDCKNSIELSNFLSYHLTHNAYGKEELVRRYRPIYNMCTDKQKFDFIYSCRGCKDKKTSRLAHVIITKLKLIEKEQKSLNDPDIYGDGI